jgi:hypothetical protein
LLSEELVLLRGRDMTNGPVAASPVYNRLFWNFTTGDGEVAYALSYDVSDQNFNGVIDEFDARIMFPQGHGDAWGHYLTGTKIYYSLLRHPFFSWDPRPEAVQVAGVPLQVDFLDERQFAETAAAKARTGAEIVDLTYRQAFVADPAGQWQGYDDTQPERAWGLSEWGRRAGMGAYLDWVTVNAVVPAKDPDPSHVGIQKIERATVSHLDEIASQYKHVQGQVDEADAGLNPLGLAQNVVPFDIDPTRLNPPFNQTQFEQIYERALVALKNAVNVWDYANELSNQLRRTQDNSDELYEHSIEEETDFTNQMIEIFGYPYADDIGPGGTYPAGYNGPDIYHYMYMDVPALAGSQFDFAGSGGQPFGVNRPEDVGEADFGIARLNSIQAKYAPMANGIGFFGTTPIESSAPRTGANGQLCTDQPLSTGCALGDVPTDKELSVTYTTIQSPDFGLWFTKPEAWTGQRRAPGKLQQVMQQMLEARVCAEAGAARVRQAAPRHLRAATDPAGDLQHCRVQPAGCQQPAQGAAQPHHHQPDHDQRRDRRAPRRRDHRHGAGRRRGLRAAEHRGRPRQRRRHVLHDQVRARIRGQHHPTHRRLHRRRPRYRRQCDRGGEGRRGAAGRNRYQDQRLAPGSLHHAGRHRPDAARGTLAAGRDLRPGGGIAPAGRRLPRHPGRGPARGRPPAGVPQGRCRRHPALSLPRHGFPHLPQRCAAEVPGRV